MMFRLIGSFFAIGVLAGCNAFGGNGPTARDQCEQQYPAIAVFWNACMRNPPATDPSCSVPVAQLAFVAAHCASARDTNPQTPRL